MVPRALGFTSRAFAQRSGFVIIFISLWEGKTCVCCVPGFNPAIVPDGLSSLWASGGSNINFSVELFFRRVHKVSKSDY